MIDDEEIKINQKRLVSLGPLAVISSFWGGIGWGMGRVGNLVKSHSHGREYD
jgi:hypothetical protein